MNKVELQDNGFPFRTHTVRFMQRAYAEAIANIAKVYGNNYILWGCEVSGAYRTEGAIVVNGEVIPFEQSPASDKFKIFESVENATYKSGVVQPTYYSKIAKCDSTGTYLFSSFKRAIPTTPASTEWKKVDYASGYQDEASYGMFSRVGENGKGLLIGTYERIDGLSAPTSALGGNEDVYFNGQVFEIAKTGLKPSKVQYVQIYGKGVLYHSSGYTIPSTNVTVVRQLQSLPSFANAGLPAIGWIGTDGILRAKFEKVTRGFNVYGNGYVCAEFDLV